MRTPAVASSSAGVAAWDRWGSAAAAQARSGDSAAAASPHAASPGAVSTRSSAGAADRLGAAARREGAIAVTAGRRPGDDRTA